MGPMPEWAQAMNLVDGRGTLPWDLDQYLALAGVGPMLIEVCLDTGGGRSMMDIDTCKALGLKWVASKGEEFGTYSTPGSDYKPYEGVT